MTGRFHPAAWLAWLAAALVAVNALTNPFALAVALAAMTVVAAAFATGAASRTFSLSLKLGATFLALRVVLFGLTGHTGDTTLFSLPEVGLPSWLGGLTLGGSVTAEVVTHSLNEGLKLAAFLACFGAFLSVADVSRLLRLLPRFLAEAGLVVTIGVVFVPTIVRSAADIRDAQRLRGHRFRGLRSSLPLVAPVLATALERSITLAESMEVRGYGRRQAGAPGAEARARAVALGGALAMASGGALALYGRGPAALRWGLTGAGLAALGGALRSLARLVPRTRYRTERPDAWDAMLGALSLALAAAVVAGPARVAAWSPYPRVAWPPLELGPTLLPAALAFPAALAALRARRILHAARRAERPALPRAAIAAATPPSPRAPARAPGEAR